MKTILLLFFLLLSYLTAFAQDRSNTLLNNWFIENNQDDAEGENFNDLVDLYDHIVFTENDIYNKEAWKQFFFLTVLELAAIEKYLDHHEKEVSVLFLNQIPILSKEKAFLVYNRFSQEQRVAQTQSKIKYFSSYSQPALSESDFKQRNRFYLSSPNASVYLQTEQDVGEDELFDFSSGGLKLSYSKLNLYLGDYIIKHGLGLSLHQGFQFSNFNILQLQNNSGIALHRGSQENNFFRGLGMEYFHNKSIALKVFGSIKKTDATFVNSEVSNIFNSGIHLTHKDQQNRNALEVKSFGVGLALISKQIKNDILWHNHYFGKRLLDLEQQTFSKQHSISNYFSWIQSQFTTSIELNLDQNTYFSYLGSFNYHLGHSFYLHYYMGKEDGRFKNYFRNIPDAYSTSEQFFGYQLDLNRKKLKAHLSYQESEKLNREIDWGKKQTLRLFTQLKTQKHQRFQLNLNYTRNYSDESDLSYEELLRTNIKLNLNKRGKWDWVLQWQIKSLNQKGIGFRQAVSYQYKAYKFHYGFAIYNQNSGAFYFFETDVPSFGYQRAYYNSGALHYVMTQFKHQNKTIYIKIRSLTDNKRKQVGLSCGFKIKI
ncbi:MAG: hypothetical protein ACPGSD_03865 [Flavobacteriales bacterium]